MCSYESILLLLLLIKYLHLFEFELIDAFFGLLLLLDLHDVEVLALRSVLVLILSANVQVQLDFARVFGLQAESVYYI